MSFIKEVQILLFDFTPSGERDMDTSPLPSEERIIFKGFKGFYLKAKAIIWPWLPSLVRIRPPCSITPRGGTLTQVMRDMVPESCFIQVPLLSEEGTPYKVSRTFT